MFLSVPQSRMALAVVAFSFIVAWFASDMPGMYFEVPLQIPFAITFGIVATGGVICALNPHWRNARFITGGIDFVVFVKTIAYTF